MHIDEFKDLISKIALQERRQEEDVLEECAEILKIKYGVLLIEQERALVDELKNKIVTRLYNYENHSLELAELNKKEAFKADTLDMDFMERAEQELVVEGLIEKTSNSIALTEAGIVKFKSFYGEM